MKRVREIVVSNVEIEDKFSWWFNTNDSQLYHFTLGKWSTLFGNASSTLDGLMTKEDKEVLDSLSMGSSVITVPTYEDLVNYPLKSEVILYVVKATNKIYRFYNNVPVEINTFYFNSIEGVKNLLGVGVYSVIVEHETYILYVSLIGSQLTYTLHSPKKYIECSYNTINSEWSEWVTTNYDAAGAILDIQNWVTAQVEWQNVILSSMLTQLTTMDQRITHDFNILYSSLNTLLSEVTTVKNNISTINNNINYIISTIGSLTSATNNLNDKVVNLENNYASKNWVNTYFATIDNLNIAKNQINTNSLNIQGLTSRVVTLEEAVATLQGISSSYMLKSEADITYATIDALSILEQQTVYNSDLITLHGVQIAELQNNTINLTDLDNINTRITRLEDNINSLYDISATTNTALNATNNNLADLETRVVELEDNKADKADTLEGYGIIDAYTKTEIDNKISAVFRYKGSVATYANLIALAGMTVGDVYNVNETGDNYAWTGTEWDKLAGEVDLSAYLTIDSASNIYETIENVNTLSSTVSGHTGDIESLQTNKQDKLIAGENIIISGNVISAELNVDLNDYLTKVDATNTYETIENVQILNDTVSAHTEDISYLSKNKANKSTTLSGYGITDVPSDDKTYGRKNGDWAEIVNSGGGGGITDAPSDNKTYGRLNATWSEIDTSIYITEPPADGFIYGRKAGVWEEINTSVGIIAHDDTLDINVNPNILHVTSAEKESYSIKSYASERVNSTGGPINLKLATKTIISNTLTNSNSLTITLPTPRLNFVNESILTIKIGSTVPNIALPTITGWYTDEVALAPMTTRTIVFEQITFDGINYEVWASCDKQ